MGFTHLRRPFGRQVAIVTPSGGAGVTYADSCQRLGFAVPELSLATQAGLAALLPPGTSGRNPVDVAQAYFRHATMADVLSTLSRDEQVSLVLFHLPMDVYVQTTSYAPWAGEALLRMLVAGNAAGTPVVVVLPHTVADHTRAEVERSLLVQGLPVFPTVERALTALGKILSYRLERNRPGSSGDSNDWEVACGSATAPSM